MLLHALINSTLPCRVLSKLIINGEPLPKSNNSPPEKEKKTIPSKIAPSKSQYTVNVDIRSLINGHCAVIVSLACVADILNLQ